MESDGSPSVDRSARQKCGCESTGTECAPAKEGTALRRLAWSLAAFCALFVVCYAFRAPLLTGVARAWMVNDPTMKADAIVVLGGGLENRPFAAAKLFHAGVAPKILYMDVKRNAAEEIGVMLTEREVTHRILLHEGIPDTAMTAIGQQVASTHDESKAVLAWMEKSGAKSIIIPTDLFHTRRVRWIFGKELRNTKAEIHVVPIGSRHYATNDWWQHEEGLIAFQNEICKSLYYHLKY